MKALLASLFTFIVSACITGKSNVNQTPDKSYSSITLDTINGFEDLISRQLGYGIKYQKLVDSLGLKMADTVCFFIRPCFKHRGVFFKINDSKCEEYFFDLSDSFNQVDTIGKMCRIVNDFFSFISSSEPAKKHILHDSVVLIPDCPVILFMKMNNVFYYKRINGKELEYFSESSIAFKKLLAETSQYYTLF